MFSYYGAKSKIARHYPAPIFDTIIEPFAGAANYSLHGDNWKKKIILVDASPLIVSIWRWLIESATPEMILELPDLKKGERVPTWLPQPAKNFMGFHVNRGCATMNHQMAEWPAKSWPRKKAQVARDLPKIKHWKVMEGSYADIDISEPATWFVDPPYENGGDRYPYTITDFFPLAQWCRRLKGQTIVCENTSATWAPFKPLVQLTGSKHKTTEAIWSPVDDAKLDRLVADL